MGVSDLGWLNGIKNGLDTTFGLLDTLDKRRDAETLRKRRAEEWAWKQDDRQYETGTLRPMETESKRLSLDDLRGQVDYYKQSRPLMLDNLRDKQAWERDDRRYLEDYTRPQQEKVDRLNYDVTKQNYDQKGFENENNNRDYFRQQHEAAIGKANQLYANAKALKDAGDFDGAAALMKQTDQMTGGYFSNMASGFNGQMAVMAGEVVAGKRSQDDPEFKAAMKRLAGPTMALSGRAGKYEYDGMDKFGDGYAHRLKKTAGTVDESIPPEGRALLDTIAGTESPGYDVIYGGSRFNDYSDHPDRDVRIKSGPNKGKTSSAAGRYQFIKPTWERMKGKLGLNDFSPISQDKAAWQLAQDDYKERTGGDLLTDLRSGKVARTGVVLSKTWTSLPSGIEAGTNASRFEREFGKNLGAYNGAVVPATIRGSSDDDDPVAMSTLDGLLEKVAVAQQAQKEFQAEWGDILDENLNRRIAASGVPLAGEKDKKDAKQPEGKDRFLTVDGKVFDMVDKTFLDPKTGGAAGGGDATRGLLVDMMGEDDPLLPHARLIDKQNPNMTMDEKVKRLGELAGKNDEGKQTLQMLEDNGKLNRKKATETWVVGFLEDEISAGDVNKDDIDQLVKEISTNDMDDASAQRRVLEALKEKYLSQREELMHNLKYNQFETQRGGYIPYNLRVTEADVMAKVAALDKKIAGLSPAGKASAP